MKILVCAKRVVDANVKVRVKADHSDVDIEHSKMSMNPFDENAIEEAVRLKEQGIATEIIAVSIGNNKCEETLRMAIARGCDRAILIQTEQKVESIHVARALSKLVATEQPQLILLGKQAIDDDANQVAQMLAGILDYPQGTFISKLSVMDNKVQIDREIDNGTETLEIDLPAIISADLHLNEPRFIKLPQLMLAKKKPIENISLESLVINIQASTRLISAHDGEAKKQCTFVTNVDELIDIINKVDKP